MNLNSKKFNSTLVEYLTNDHMHEIHSAALEILEDSGTIVHHEEAVELLHSAGAYVKDGNRVFLPAGPVEAAIRSAPSRTAIYDRNGNPAMMEGIRVDREHLALDAIKRVGPGGHFLQDDHTLNHFRDNWQPDITDRTTHETWTAAGATTMGQRAKEKIKHILESHTPEPLPPDINKEIDRILERAKAG